MFYHVSETCPIAHQNLLSFIYKLIILLQFEPPSSQDLCRVKAAESWSFIWTHFCFLLKKERPSGCWNKVCRIFCLFWAQTVKACVLSQENFPCSTCQVPKEKLYNSGLQLTNPKESLVWQQIPLSHPACCLAYWKISIELFFQNMHKPLPGCNREIKSNPSSQNCVVNKSKQQERFYS